MRIKREKVFDNISRFYFIPRESAPLPTTNTRLYRYNAAKDDIETWWILPDPQTLMEVLRDPTNKYSLDSAVRSQYEYCSLFVSKKLDEYANSYNDKITKSRLRPGFNPKDYDYGDLTVQQ